MQKAQQNRCFLRGQKLPAVLTLPGKQSPNFNANVKVVKKRQLWGQGQGQAKGGRDRDKRKPPGGEPGGRAGAGRSVGDRISPPRDPYPSQRGKGVGSHPYLLGGVSRQSSGFLLGTSGFNRKEGGDLLPGNLRPALRMIGQHPGRRLAAHPRRGLGAEIERPLMGNNLPGQIPFAPRQRLRLESRFLDSLPGQFPVYAPGIACANPSDGADGFKYLPKWVPGFLRPGIGDG